tara:strand:- start:100 stop:255 length:156 start_codon:yes stop_codon:yes gene_type:complete
MITELTEINKQLKTYLYSNNQEQIDYAENYLRNVHRKYGTVDTQIIKNIIR